jgi:hypothetical protein
MSASGFDSIAMSWPPCPDEDFLAYRLYRSVDSAADSTDQLLLESSDAMTNAYVDRDVEANGVYRYRLYTFDTWEQASAAPSVRGGAQEFIALNSEPKLILPRPGTNQFLVASRQYLYLAAGDGALLDSLALADYTQRWLISADGTAAWGLDESAGLARVDLVDFTLAGQVELGGPGFDLTELGDGRLVISLAMGGAPQLRDAATLDLIEALDELDDMGLSTRLAADPAGPILYLAEGGNALRLRSVDLASQATILDTRPLPTSTQDLHLDPGQSLLLALTFEDTLTRIVLDAASPGLLDSAVTIALGSLPPWSGAFNTDGSQLWMKWLGGDYTVRAYDTQSGAATLSFEQVSNSNWTMILADGSRVATALIDYRISLCDPGRGRLRGDD